MKKIIVLFLAMAMSFCGFTACNDNSSDDNKSSSESGDVKTDNVIALGVSGLSIKTSKKYEKGEITTEDTDENQVAYYKSKDSDVDFDVYEWAKASGETLDSVAKKEAADYKDAEVKTKTINSLNIAYYYAVEKASDDNKEHNTVTYIIDNGDYFVELVFWLDGDNAQAYVDGIMATIAKDKSSSGDVNVDSGIALGASGLSVSPAKKYVKGEITSEDTDENQVAYYKSSESDVDFDVYEWAKASGETLDAAAKKEAADYDNAEVKTKTINGFNIAYYYAVEKASDDNKEHNTVTYIIDNGDYFVELVFWLDGDNAQAEVDAIMNTLKKK